MTSGVQRHRRQRVPAVQGDVHHRHEDHARPTRTSPSSRSASRPRPGRSTPCVTVGPDGKLYAGTFDGLIQRFTINADGTLSAPQNITTVRTANGGQPDDHRPDVRPVQHGRQPGRLGQPRPVRRRPTPATGPARSAGCSGAEPGHVPGLRDQPAAQRPRPPDEPDRLRPRRRALLQPGQQHARWAPRTTPGATAPSTCSTRAILRLDTDAVAQRIAAGQALNVKTENDPTGGQLQPLRRRRR